MSVMVISFLQVSVAWLALTLKYWEYVEISQRLAIGEVDEDVAAKVRRHQVALQIAKANLAHQVSA